MKHIVGLIAMLLCMLPLSMNADNYTQLWKEFEAARSKDLPKTELEVLEKISRLASREKAYGHLVKAQLLTVGLQSAVSPDSLQPARARVEALEQRTTDPALKAVYDVVIGRMYETDYDNEEREARRDEYYARAMDNPDALAAIRDASYAPLVEVGVDSKVFNHDLLHVIGFETKAYAALHKYYEAKGNRSAACYTALELNGQEHTTNEQRTASLDSLLRLYGDLPIACEVAIRRYNLMRGGSTEANKARFDYLNEAIAKWKDYPRVNVLRNNLSRLTQPEFSVNVAKTLLLPGREQQLKVNLARNIRELTMKVYRVDALPDDGGDVDNARTLARLMKSARLQADATQAKNFAGHPAYEETEDSITLKGLPLGAYLLEFQTDNKSVKPSRMLVRVSNLQAVWTELPDHSVRIAVVNATTGEPVPGARLALSRNESAPETIINTDAKGENLLKGANYSYIRIFKGEDLYSPRQYFRPFFSYYDTKISSYQVSLYTDRALYRPGQTVHVAMVAYGKEEYDELNVLRRKEYTLTLRDANGKEVEQKKVTTDEFGSASADFVLPTGGLTGEFSVRANTGAVYFHVEEYKRPTFEVEFDEYKEKYEAGDTIMVSGKARSYAGVPVQGAKVAYTISRNRSLWWGYWNGQESGYGQLRQDTTVTDANGEFKIRVPMTLPERHDGKPIFCNIVVNATVTDLGGESRDGRLTLPVSSKPTAFACDMPQRELKDSLRTLTFGYRNNAGKEIPGTVAYTIDNKKYTAKANEELDIRKQMALLKSGQHHLQALCGNDTIEQDFVVFSLQDNKAVVETHDWFYQTAEEFPRDGSPVHIQLGSSDPVQHVVYTIMSGKKLFESGVIDLRGELHNRSFTYKPEYGTGLVLNYAWVKEGVVYRHNVQIRKPLPDKRLIMKWTTFRDKLVPGQQEEWTLNIIRPGDKAAKAQLYATLFDKSLDQIRKHGWFFNPPIWYSYPQTAWIGGFLRDAYASSAQGIKWLKVDAFTLSRICYLEFNAPIIHKHAAVKVRGIGMLSKEAAAPASVEDGIVACRADVRVRGRSVASGDEALNESIVVGYGFKGKSETAGEEDSPGLPGGQIRENLEETAFFYPNLETDAQGNVKIKFTLPESITTWRFIGFAHDSQMNYGFLEGEAVAKKTVMVQPNMPRFLRTGDKATISSKVFNTTSEPVSGTLTMQLADAATGEIVYGETAKYRIPANGTTSVNFSYKPESADRMLVCKIVASGKNYSDGEQHYLPILPDMELVTTTVPFTQNSAGIKTIDLDKLFPVKRADNSLTVEYTDNPAWLMVQALPYVGDVNEHNAISLAAAYYANSIASNLLRQSPVIKQTLDLWKQEKGTETTLMSSLEKNQELKSMLLEETPWVMDAEKETSQRRQLINFFDENMIPMRLDHTLDKLRELQRQDGSFSWWSGMEGSPYMTMAVTKMLARLNRMIGNQEPTRQMLSKAFGFLDKEIRKEVVELKRLEKKGVKILVPTELACNYLYCNALAGRPTTADINYLLNLLVKQPAEYTIYGKANSAIILSLYGKDSKAREYLQSVKEYTVYKEEMGRYFDTPKAQYSWFDYRIPSQVAAIEALKQLQPTEKQTIEEMQRWLLQEKRTQSWDTPLNSVDAVYAFLNGQTDKLTPADNTPAVLEVDGRELSADHRSAAIGYVKGRYQGADLRQFTARKTTGHTSWGAVYAQFMQKSAEVQNASAGLTVRREILNEGRNLRVGDKVKVRITVTADRDYDFVQVQDKRAACMEPVGQLSGYHWGYYCAPKDNTTNYYFDRLAKGKHVVETEYYIDREGDYQTGTCTVQCAYSPEFMAREAAKNLNVK